jgi:methionyl-tRNA formyltransferase
MRASQGAVKRLALEHGLEVFQPDSLSGTAARERIAAVRADFLVVAAYGLILPEAVLALARLGALNIHASLLPRWRGAAPIQRAILAGDVETGITIMRMDAGLDTGPMLRQSRIPIAPDDDAGSLHDKLAAEGARLIVAVLADFAAGRGPEAVPQPAEGATYARKIAKQEQAIDWRADAAEVARRVRALSPAPGATARRRGEILKIWRAQEHDARGAPGEVVAVDADGILVACGARAVRLTALQRAGGRRLPAAEFLRGCGIAPGDRLE